MTAGDSPSAAGSAGLSFFAGLLRRSRLLDFRPELLVVQYVPLTNLLAGCCQNGLQPRRVVKYRRNTFSPDVSRRGWNPASATAKMHLLLSASPAFSRYPRASRTFQHALLVAMGHSGRRAAGDRAAVFPQAQAAAAGSPQHLPLAQVGRRPARQLDLAAAAKQPAALPATGGRAA